MKKILVPVDFSEFSENAVNYAITLISKAGGDIRLFHVFYDPYINMGDKKHGEEPNVSGQDVLYKLQKEKEEGLKNLFGHLNNEIAKKNLTNITCSYELKNGVPENEIIKEAAVYRPNLILMGTHGHNKINRLFFGSVTQGLIRNAHFPVLAIPHNYEFKDIKEVAYFTNFSNEDIYSIGKVINLFSPFEIKLHITHFNLEDDREKDESKMFALHEQLINDYKNIKIDFEIIDSNIMRDAYKQYSEQKKIDLIALTARKMSNFKRLFKPGTATEMLYHSNIPIIVFHEE